MAAMKYDKYITTECVKEITKRPGAFITSTRHLEDFGGGELSVDAIYISHTPDADPIPSARVCAVPRLFLLQPRYPVDFDAEIGLSLGEEQEKHVITCPTSVYIAVGLFPGPPNFFRIDRPVLFLNIAVTDKYSRIGNTPD